MTFFGKILVFLIMVMSLLFLGFSVAVYSANQNWQLAVTNEKNPAAPPGLKQKLEQLKEQQAQDAATQQRYINDINLEAKTKAEQAAKFETENVQLAARIAALEAENTKLADQSREAVAAMSTLQQKSEALADDSKKIREENIAISRTRDEHFGEVVRLTDQLNQQRAELERLEKRSRELTKEVSNLQELAAYHKISNLDPKSIQNPPNVEGKIVALNAATKLYEISLGSDDGIVPGHELKIFRMGTQPRYLGTIKIVDSQPDRAVGKLVEGTQQGPIERDDHVATNLR